MHPFNIPTFSRTKILISMIFPINGDLFVATHLSLSLSLSLFLGMTLFSYEKLHLSRLRKWVRFFLRQLRTTCSSAGRRGMKPRRQLPASHAWLSSSFAGMEVSSQLKQVFRMIDANGDGKISPLELREVLLCLGHEAATAAREAEEMVREVDRDGDGLIDLEEFMGVVDGGEHVDGKEEEDLAAAFRVFDADGNGFISAKELRKVLVGLGHGRCSLKDCSRMIGGVDRNGDGLVDFEEFQSMMSRRRTLTLTSDSSHVENGRGGKEEEEEEEEDCC